MDPNSTAGATRIGLLFVCMGNICRSPVAEAVFSAQAAALGLSGAFDVDSAGTIDLHAGEAPDPRSVAEARRHGIALTHRSRPLRAADFGRFDWMLAMDQRNLAAIAALAPAGARARRVLLRSFDPTAPAGAEVPDPYYGGAQGFDHVLDLVEDASEGLLLHVQSVLSLDKRHEASDH